MAKRRPRDIGTAAETAVVRWLQANGWPHAERRALRGNQDAGDITGTPGLCWEVKAGQAGITATDGTVRLWLDKLEGVTNHVDADFGILIQRRCGKANPANWWVWMPLHDLMRLPGQSGGLTPDDLMNPPCRLRLDDFTGLLRDAGYGDPR